jgi:quercetin dioxygenase-like cupin family protein
LTDTNEASTVLHIASLEWQPVRPDLAQGVYGKTLMANGLKVVLTCVAPGGGFPVHRDDYGHLFYFLSGEGFVRVGEKQLEARPGLVVRVAVGEAHAYGNTGTEDMTLVSLNVPGS